MSFHIPEDQAEALRKLKNDVLTVQNQFIGAVRLIIMQNRLEGQWSPSEDCSELVPEDAPRVISGSGFSSMESVGNGK